MIFSNGIRFIFFSGEGIVEKDCHTSKSDCSCPDQTATAGADCSGFTLLPHSSEVTRVK